jgi:4-hydroxy-tetrahydrodipicolinate synthase
VSAGLRGTWFVLPTPFTEDGSLDLDGQVRLAKAAVSWGVDGATAMGVTSEAASLAEEEREAALHAISGALAGRVPLVVGCSAADPAAVTERIRRAAELGASAAMVSAPPGGRIGVGELPAFFARAAEEGDLPLVIQDEPAATGVVMSSDILLRSVEAAGARTVKLEDPPTPPKIARLLHAEPELAVFGGLGGAFALAELRAGARGTMTGFAFPEILGAVRRSLEGGEEARAAALFDRYLPLIQFEAQPVVGLAVRKELLRRRGVIDTAVTRGTVRRLDAVTDRELGDVLRRLHIDPGPEPFEPREGWAGSPESS